MAESQQYYDISRALRGELAPWPGDTPFAYRLTWRMADGAPVNVGAVTMGMHNGTHADAPLHYQADGASIDALDPAIFVGPARVVDVSGAGFSITRDHLSTALDGRREGIARLLLKTGAWPDDAQFPARIPTLAPDVPAWLAERGVRLLGLDVPSVDAIDSKDLPVHHALAAVNILILESLDLSLVPEGVYELIALPLKIAGGDASPIRAVLRELRIG